jgi:hypothetical protein
LLRAGSVYRNVAVVTVDSFAGVAVIAAATCGIGPAAATWEAASTIAAEASREAAEQRMGSGGEAGAVA